MNRTKKYSLCLITLLSCLLFSSCDKENTDDPSGGDGNETFVKPCYIWVDASANFRDFANSKENITYYLNLAKTTGFTDIVVDVRPSNGDLLFGSNTGDQVQYLCAWVDHVYTKIERKASWDYLQAFIDEGHRLGLRIHASINTFVGGATNALGKHGVVFRDAEKAQWTTGLNMKNGIVDIKDGSTGKTIMFFNPAKEEVQNYLLNILGDLAKYDLDGILLDRCRYDGIQSDFSEETKKQFEAYIGETIANYPDDILSPGTTSLPSAMPKYCKKWLEFRAKVIHDFIVKARDRIKSVNPKISFGVYVGGWYNTYYESGVNWGSPKYDTSIDYRWATPEYKNFGYADHLDQMCVGAYKAANKVKEIEDVIIGAMKVVKGDVKVFGGLDGNNYYPGAAGTEGVDVPSAITKSTELALKTGAGFFFFDMVHLKDNNQWEYVQKGIEKVNAK